MEPFKRTRVLELPENAIHEIRKTHNLEKPGRIEEAVDILEQWVQKQDHFIKKDFKRDYLERTIVLCKGSVEKAKKQIDRLCTMKTLLPQFFTKTNAKKELNDVLDIVRFHYRAWQGNFQKTMNAVLFLFKNKGMFPLSEISYLQYLKYLPSRSIAFLPAVTSDFYRVVMVKVHDKPITEKIILEYYQFAMIQCEYFKAHGYNNGFIVVLDYQTTNILELVTKANPVLLQQFVSILVEGFGARLKGIYILSQSKVIDLVTKMAKQFLSQKISDRLHVIKTLEELHRAVPKDILPVEYGGKERSFETLVADLVDELSTEEHVKYMEMMNKAGTNESLRQSSQFNQEYMGMPGSFRNMTVD